MEYMGKRIAEFCIKTLELHKISPLEEYNYKSFPFAVIDAVFSIGVKYSSTEAVVKRYCNFYKLQRIRDTKDFPPEEEQHTITEFIKNIEYNADVFENKQRTSPVNGILKSQAVLLWAKIFESYNIQTLQDFEKKHCSELEYDLKKVKGQGSGISLTYLKMLCGNDDYCKPDRHIIRFVFEATGKNVTPTEASMYLNEACSILKKDFDKINLRLLDNAIWQFMSKRKD